VFQKRSIYKRFQTVTSIVFKYRISSAIWNSVRLFKYYSLKYFVLLYSTTLGRTSPSEQCGMGAVIDVSLAWSKMRKRKRILRQRSGSRTIGHPSTADYIQHVCLTTAPVRTRLHCSADFQHYYMCRWREMDRSCEREAQCGQRTKRNRTKTTHHTNLRMSITVYSVKRV